MTNEQMLRDAAIALRDDLIERGTWDKDGAGKVVCAGNGVWVRFNEALAATRDDVALPRLEE